ncbi:hypothetical protein ACQJBY_068312 [Aegilops geniculata]
MSTSCPPTLLRRVAPAPAATIDTASLHHPATSPRASTASPASPRFPPGFPSPQLSRPDLVAGLFPQLVGIRPDSRPVPAVADAVGLVRQVSFAVNAGVLEGTPPLPFKAPRGRAASQVHSWRLVIHGPDTFIHYFDIATLHREDASCLRLWAWSDNPSSIPKVQRVTFAPQVPNGPAGAPSAAIGHRGFRRRAIVYLYRLEDFSQTQMARCPTALALILSHGFMGWLMGKRGLEILWIRHPDVVKMTTATAGMMTATGMIEEAATTIVIAPLPGGASFAAAPELLRGGRMRSVAATAAVTMAVEGTTATEGVMEGVVPVPWTGHAGGTRWMSEGARRRRHLVLRRHSDQVFLCCC